MAINVLTIVFFSQLRISLAYTYGMRPYQKVRAIHVVLTSSMPGRSATDSDIQLWF